MKTDIQIAYADDNSLLRPATCTALSSIEGIHCFAHASDAASLLASIRRSALRPGVILLNGPSMVSEAQAAVKTLREAFPQTGIICIAPNNQRFYVCSLLQADVNAVLPKTAPPDVLRTAIHSVFRDGYYYSDVAPAVLYTKIRKGLYRLPSLTRNELMVLHQMDTGMGYLEIGQKLQLTKRSTEGYRDSLFRKFGVHSRTELVMEAMRRGLLQLRDDEQS